MRISVYNKVARTVIICMCAAPTSLPCWSLIKFAQTATAAKPAAENTFGTVVYKEDQGPFHAKVELQSSATSSGLVFSIRQNTDGPPPLEDQARLISVLLQHVIRDRPDLTHLGVMFGDEREAFIAPLNAYLLHSPQWNPHTGRPRHGTLGNCISEAIKSQGILKSFQNSFQENGFVLTLEGVSRIDIEKVPSMQSALLPVHIDSMYFKAEKTNKAEVKR